MIRVRQVEKEPQRVLIRPKYGWGRRSWETGVEFALLVGCGVALIAFTDWVRALWDMLIG